jgi:hypothetical protein
MNMKALTIRSIARTLVLVGAVAALVIGINGFVLDTTAFLVVPGALFVVGVVMLAAVIYAVDEVLQKQAERIQMLEQLLAQHRPGQT